MNFESNFRALVQFHCRKIRYFVHRLRYLLCPSLLKGSLKVEHFLRISEFEYKKIRTTYAYRSDFQFVPASQAQFVGFEYRYDHLEGSYCMVQQLKPFRPLSFGCFKKLTSVKLIPITITISTTSKGVLVLLELKIDGDLMDLILPSD